MRACRDGERTEQATWQEHQLMPSPSPRGNSLKAFLLRCNETCCDPPHDSAWGSGTPRNSHPHSCTTKSFDRISPRGTWTWVWSHTPALLLQPGSGTHIVRACLHWARSLSITRRGCSSDEGLESWTGSPVTLSPLRQRLHWR